MRISDWSSDVCSSDLGHCASSISIPNKLQNFFLEMTAQNSAALYASLFSFSKEKPIPIRSPDAVSTRRATAKGFRWPSPKTLRGLRSEERRVRKEWVSRWRSRWSPYQYKKNLD